MQLVKDKTIYSRSAMVALWLVLFSTAGIAQPAPTVHHPGETLTLTIVFEGVDAHKLQTAGAYFTAPNAPNDQAGFTSDFGFSESKADGPGTLKLSYKILPNAASGVYKLTQIRAGTLGDGAISVIYNEGLPVLTIAIENDRRFVKPTIKSVKEP
jgi:hypothetical protein